MENKECRCENCEYFNDCEIGILLHNPFIAKREALIGVDIDNDVAIKKGEKIAQIKLVEHKSYLIGYGSEEVRDGGFGSTGE